MKIVKSKESPVRTLDDVDGHVVTAYKRHSSIKDPLDFLNGVSELDYNSESIYDIMEACMRLYKLDALCGQAIDTMVNFVTTNVSVQPTGSKQLDNIVKIFLQYVNSGSGVDPGMYHLTQRMALGFLTVGNVFPLKTYKMLNFAGHKISLPTRVTLLNPTRVHVDKAGLDFGPKTLLYRLSDDLVKTLNKDGRKSKEKKNVPSLIKRQYKRSVKGPNRHNQHLVLNDNLVDHLKRKSMDYEDWGVPFLTRVFRAVTVMNRLRRLDEATLEGLINLITIFKIGSDEFPATADRLTKFKNILESNGVTNPNKYLVWSHDVDILQVGPDNKILSFENRYHDATQDVKNGLGLPGATRGEAQSGDVWPSFVGMLENLVSVRETITRWLEDTIIQIADQNNIEIKERPVINWGRMNLTNETEVKNLILAFYDRGLIDPETALEESNRDYSSILNRKKKFDKDGLEELFKHPDIPFTSNDKGASTMNEPKSGEGDKDKDKGQDKEKDSKFESTAAIDSDILVKAFEEIFDNHFVTLEGHIRGNSDSELIKGFVIGKAQQLIQHVNNYHSASDKWGVASESRQIVEKHRDVFLRNFNSSYNVAKVDDVIKKLLTYKSNVWKDLRMI